MLLIRTRAALPGTCRDYISIFRAPLFAALIFAWGASAWAQMGPPLSPNLPPAATSEPVLDWNTGAGKSYVIPSYEVPGFLLGLNMVDRVTIPHDVYDSTFASTWEHVHEQHWVFDTDPFNVNQFAHPYQGMMMFSFARSTGVSFWQSLFYSTGGSFLWKMAGETDLPSINDQITTSTAGALLGESLFRMANLLLEGGGPHPGFWRELGAAALSPPTAFNRLVFGERFKPVFPSYDPATFFLLNIGTNTDLNVTKQNIANTIKRAEATADVAFAYGLPGKEGYEYSRPFDYFTFEFAGETSTHAHNFIEDILVNGLLYGKDYELGENFRGITGIYGSYDYISPQVFRVSSTAVSYGTTGQWWMSRYIAVQGTATTGVGFGAGGTTPTADGLRDYHYGVTPQALLSLRFIFGNRMMFDVTGREYYVSGTGSDDSQGSELIYRGTAGLTIRLFGHQALGLKFVESNRHAHYGNRPDANESEGTYSLVYTFLGGNAFGASEWRAVAEKKTD